MLVDELGQARLRIHPRSERAHGPFSPGDTVVADISLPSTAGDADPVKAALIFCQQYCCPTTDAGPDIAVLEGCHERLVSVQILEPDDFCPSGVCQMRLPEDAAPTYVSRAIRTSWLVRIFRERPHGKELLAQTELPLLVPPPGLATTAGGHGYYTHPDEADIRIWLPRLEWVEGEIIGGRLVVRSFTDVVVRGIHMTVERHERLEQEPYYETFIEKRTRASGRVRFLGGEATVFPFTMTLPKKGCPSLQTEHVAVTWRVWATLKRWAGEDWLQRAKIYVYGGWPPGQASSVPCSKSRTEGRNTESAEETQRCTEGF